MDKIIEALIASGPWGIVLGLVTAASAAMIYALWKSYETCADKRVQDKEPMHQLIREMLLSMQANTQAQIDRTRAQEASAKAQELTSMQLRELNTFLRDEFRRFREDFGGRS